MRKIFFTCFIVFILSSAWSCSYAYAANVSPKIIQSKDGVTRVAVMIDTQGDSVNAIAGTLRYNPSIFRVQSIRTLDSIVSFWIDRPAEKTAGVISWTGAIPGGFDGVRNALSNVVSPGVVFTVEIVPAVSGSGTVSLEALDVRLNDGKATAAAITTVPLTLSVDGRYINAQVPSEDIASDAEVGLTAVLLHDKVLTQGKWAVAFTADTNRTTISRYEIAESFQQNPLAVAPSAWVSAESPFILSDQYRSHYIHVRAIAQNGSVYTRSIAPADFSTEATALTWGILILVVVSIIIALVRMTLRKK